MAETNPLGLTRRLLLGPGPSEVHPRVLAALGVHPLGHLDPQFLALMGKTQDMLRQLFRTQNPLTLPISGTGMAGMEACMVNLLEPGDKVVVCSAGFFGQRMIEVAGRTRAEVTVLERPFGQVFGLDTLRDTLRRVRPKVLGIVHAETSTGALQPNLPEIGALCRETDTLLLVDAVTSLGGVPVDVDAWGIDAIYSGTQKCLSAPPGLSPVTLSARAAEALGRRTTPVQSWYFDLTMLQRYLGQERFYHHTAPISMVFALYEALRIVFEEGLEARFERHRRHAAAMKAGVEAIGLKYATVEGHRLPMLHCLRIPDGVEDLPVRRRLLEEFSIEVGGGLGEFKGKVWRVGLMGVGSSAENVLKVLEALEDCLVKVGLRFPPNAGVDAAEAVLGSAATA